MQDEHTCIVIINAAIWKSIRSYIAIVTACTCISVAIYSILKRPAYSYIYAGLVSVHIHSYLYLKQKLDISQLKRMNYVGPCRSLDGNINLC